MNATFNQLHNWKQTSYNWYLINNMPEDKRNLDRNFKDYGRSPYVNVFWREISKEFKNKFGDEFKYYAHFDLFTKEPVGICYQYPSVYIHTSIVSCLEHQISFEVCGIRFKDGYNRKGFYITPKTNIPITKEYIKKEVFNYIEKNILFPKGFFRDIQQAKNCCKSDVKTHYKNWLHREKEIDIYDYEIRKYIERRYRICIDESIYVTDWNDVAIFCRNYIKAHGKPKEIKTVYKFRMDGILDNFDGDIYEAEELFWEHVDSYGANAILV